MGLKCPECGWSKGTFLIKPGFFDKEKKYVVCPNCYEVLGEEDEVWSEQNENKD